MQRPLAIAVLVAGLAVLGASAKAVRYHEPAHPDGERIGEHLVGRLAKLGWHALPGSSALAGLPYASLQFEQAGCPPLTISLLGYNADLRQVAETSHSDDIGFVVDGRLVSPRAVGFWLEIAKARHLVRSLTGGRAPMRLPLLGVVPVPTSGASACRAPLAALAIY